MKRSISNLLSRKLPSSPCSLAHTSRNEPWRSFASQARRRRDRTGRWQPAPPKKIMFQSLGCPRNFVDTEVMLGMSVQSGMEVTHAPEEADYVVVNTCGFLESARAESKEAIEDLIATKKDKSKLLVTGCMVNLHKSEILDTYPEVDSVLGSGAIDKVLETIERIEGSGERLVQSANRRSFLEGGETPRFLATPPHYAYLKIAEGCKKQCSFCIIPKIKGRLQSKPVDQLVDEFQAVLDHGASEIILIAQDLGDYGKDFGVGSDSKSPADLGQLLRALLDSTDDPNLWLRLLYLYPDEITPELIDIMQSDERICRYLDMPIQHSHNDMLRAMRRKTTAEEIKNTIITLRDKLPGIQIRTSLMVGFPGETEEHFEHLLSFVREMELDNVGVFTYSDEAMAYSSRLPNHVPEDVKHERFNRLMEAQLEIVERKNQERVERKDRLEVVVEGMEDDRILCRYYGQCPDIDGNVVLEGNPSVYAGARYTVEVTGFDQYDLVGRVVH